MPEFSLRNTPVSRLLAADARRGVVLAALTLVAAILATACSDGTGQERAGTIETVDGVVWVRNPAAAPATSDLASSPSESSDLDPALSFSLELEQTFGVEEEPASALLSFVMALTVDDSGNVYVVDRSDNQIVAFAPDGEVLWRAGRSGQGPGELDGPNYIAWDGRDLLYVDNRSAGQIDTWTTGGQHVGSQGLADFGISQGWVVGLPDPGTLVLRGSSRTQGDGAMVHVFDTRNGWRRTAEFFALGGRLSDSDEQGFWATATVAVAGDSIWVGNALVYELREYSLDGILRRVIAREHAPLLPYFVYRGTGFSNGSFRPPLWTPDGHGLVPRYWLVGIDDVEVFKQRWDRYLASRDPADSVREYDSAIDLIDPEGRVLSSLSIGGMYDAIGWPETVGPDGKLYTRVFEPYPHIRRYRIELAEEQ